MGESEARSWYLYDHNWESSKRTVQQKIGSFFILDTEH